MTPSEDAARKSEHEPVSISHSKGESPKQGSHLGKGLEGRQVLQRPGIWAHIPNSGLPSLCPFPRLHAGITERRFRAEWRSQKRQCPTAEHTACHTGSNYTPSLPCVGMAGAMGGATLSLPSEVPWRHRGPPRMESE